MSFAKSLKEARLKANLTQKELADILEVKQSTIANWEAGIREPKINDLEHIALALMTTPTRLIK